MTTIIFDKERLVVDSRTTYNNFHENNNTKKMYRHNNKIFCFAGRLDLHSPILDSFDSIENDISILSDIIDEIEDTTAVCYIDVSEKRPHIYEYNTGYKSFIKTYEKFATGSGAQFALGAMEAGANALEALRVVSCFDHFTNNYPMIYNLSADKITCKFKEF